MSSKKSLQDPEDKKYKSKGLSKVKDEESDSEEYGSEEEAKN
jgi:hypothetical protein